MRRTTSSLRARGFRTENVGCSGTPGSGSHSRLMAAKAVRNAAITVPNPMDIPTVKS